MRLREIMLYDSRTGREWKPCIRELAPDVPKPIQAWLYHRDLGISRVIGMITKSAWNPRTGATAIGVALVETGDPDGCEWMEWVPIPSDAEEFGNRLIAERERVSTLEAERSISVRPTHKPEPIGPMLDHEALFDQDGNFLGEQGWMVD